MKILNAVLALLFVTFAILQFNDPDPALWVLVYGYTAMISVMALLGRVRKYFLIVGILALVLLAASKVPGVIDWINSSNHAELFGEMYKEKPYIEDTREFGGLLMALIAIVINFRSNKNVQ